jgi:hypothetical protein
MILIRRNFGGFNQIRWRVDAILNYLEISQSKLGSVLLYSIARDPMELIGRGVAAPERPDYLQTRNQVTAAAFRQ